MSPINDPWMLIDERPLKPIIAARHYCTSIDCESYMEYSNGHFTEKGEVKVLYSQCGHPRTVAGHAIPRCPAGVVFRPAWRRVLPYSP